MNWWEALKEWFFGKPAEPESEPAPVPPAWPAPVPVTVTDAINPALVVWHGPSPADFLVTASLGGVKIFGKTITWSWSHPGWTEEDGNTGGVVGNLWVFAKIKGKWHAATFEWLRRNTIRSRLEARTAEENRRAWIRKRKKAGKPIQPEPKFHDDPPFIQASDGAISTWWPAPGEEIGFMASTMCRGGIPKRSVRQRSPIVLVRWP